MPFPILGILGGLSAAAGAAGGLHQLGAGIADRRRAAREREVANRAQAAAVRGRNAAASVQNPALARPGNFWEGTPATQGGIGTYNLYTPEQQAAFSSVLQSALGNLGRTSFNFDPIERQAREGFQQRTIPSLAERFTAMGSGPNSGAFNRAVAGAGRSLETDLAAARQGYNLQQQALLQNLLGIGLKPQFESYYQPGQEGLPGFRDQLLGNLLNPQNVMAGLQGIGNFAQQIGQNRASRQAAAQQAPIQQQFMQQPQQQMQAQPTVRGTMNALANPANVVGQVPQFNAAQPTVTGMMGSLNNPANVLGQVRMPVPRVPTTFNPAENTQFSGFFGI